MTETPTYPSKSVLPSSLHVAAQPYLLLKVLPLVEVLLPDLGPNFMHMPHPRSLLLSSPGILCNQLHPIEMRTGQGHDAIIE